MRRIVQGVDCWSVISVALMSLVVFGIAGYVLGGMEADLVLEPLDVVGITVAVAAIGAPFVAAQYPQHSRATNIAARIVRALGAVGRKFTGSRLNPMRPIGGDRKTTLLWSAIGFVIVGGASFLYFRNLGVETAEALLDGIAFVGLAITVVIVVMVVLAYAQSNPPGRGSGRPPRSRSRGGSRRR